MKKILKSNNGITLVALVVTIIVLLILAGVSLNLVAGSNGILSRANNAVNATNLAKIKEELELKIAEMQLDYYSESSLQSTYTTANEYVKAELKKGIEVSTGADITCDDDGNLSYDGLEIGTLNSDGTITIDGEFNGGQMVSKYKVTYNANGGTGSVPATAKYDSGETVTVDFSTLPTRTGGTFLGWAKDKNATTPEYTNSGSFTINQNTTLYAVWKMETYTITFDANGGTVSPTSIAAEYGAAISLPTPTKTNYAFTGWYTAASEGSKIEYTTMPLNGATVYAQWQRSSYEGEALSLGQEVTVGGEQFFVIEDSSASSATVKLLAKFNLNQEGTAQLNDSYSETKCIFSSSQYWSENSADLNIDSAPSGSAYQKAKAYGTIKGGTGRLLTYAEATSLQSSSSDILYGKNIGASDDYLVYWLGTSENSYGVQGNVFNAYGPTPSLRTFPVHLGRLSWRSTSYRN